MKVEEYEKIVSQISKQRQENLSAKMFELFPDVPKRCLESIISQEYRSKIKKTIRQTLLTNKIEKYYEKYLEYKNTKPERGFLLKIAHELDYSPAIIAKAILQKAYPNARPLEIKEFMRNPAKITDLVLAREVNWCITKDDFCGPYADVLRRSIGLGMEQKLKRILTECKISFIDENDMRLLGYDKTPDFKLQIPISVGNYLINWIESKASFGDWKTHQEYLETQYKPYENRFGPGLVIYWFGFIDELPTPENIYILDHMPPDIKHMFPDSMMTLA